MTFEEYVPLALKTEKTEPFFHNDHQWSRQMHGAVGLSTEVGELLDCVKKNLIYGKPLDVHNVREEVGDALWYMALYLDACGFDHKSLESEVQREAYRFEERGNALALCITLVYYSTFLLTQTNARDASAQHVMGALEDLTEIYSLLQNIVNETDAGSMSDIFELNLAKLAKRYEKGFSKEAALNRDLDAERKILETPLVGSITAGTVTVIEGGVVGTVKM